MDVRWNGETQCQLALPDPLPQQLLDEGQNLLLLCTRRACFFNVRKELIMLVKR